jgi:molecular chaperone DnaK (HSP70)
MLAVVYGSGLREEPQARSRSSSWDDLRRRTEEATRRAEQARRERENAEAKAAADRATQQRERAFREKQRRASQPDFGEDAAGYNRAFAEPILAELYALREKWSDKSLSEREAEFVEDVLNRGKDYRTTPAQDAWIRDIIQKYQRYAARRRNAGDAESFWHS